MTRLILHIGPGKCGSTTIQQLCAKPKKAFKQSVGFHFFDPAEFVDLNAGVVTAKRLTILRDLLMSVTLGHEAVIFSHEFLFQTPQAVQVIVKQMKAISSDVLIIGYSRSQSSLLRSTYSQWLFRDRARLHEIASVMQSAGFSPHYFTGLERQFIASIIDDFYSARQLSGYNLLDLLAGYQSLKAVAAEVDFKVGVLPNPKHSFSLIDDFCGKAGLELLEDASYQPVLNPKFNAGLVCALNAAMVEGMLHMTPHEGNAPILELSSRMPHIFEPRPAFLKTLFNYTDNYFSKRNFALTQQFDLPRDYFSQDASMDKRSVLALIETEMEHRKSTPNILTSYYNSVEYAILSARKAA